MYSFPVEFSSLDFKMIKANNARRRKIVEKNSEIIICLESGRCFAKSLKNKNPMLKNVSALVIIFATFTFLI